MRPSTLIRRPAMALAALLVLTGSAGASATVSGPAGAGTLSVLPPVTDPATLCITTFNDANADGARDPDEAVSSGWQVTVRDRDGLAVGSIVTDAATPACINLAAAVYAVSERAQPGWQATTSGQATQAVTLVSATTTTVTFGNHRCCTTFTYRRGRADNFSLANGARAEPVTPVSATATPMYFDATSGNHALAQRFRLGTANCVVSASLRIRVRALPGGSANDSLRLRVPGAASWSLPIASVPPTGSWRFSPSHWTAKTIVLDVDALPAAGGTRTLLTPLNAAHVLDVIVGDDTSVDYVRLIVAFGICPDT